MKTPEKGFYYHYKHDPKGDVGNYAYEVTGIGLHTEGEHDTLNPKYMFVLYRPLYESFIYKSGKLFDVRPLEMFIEKVTKDGKEMERFSKITDPKIIKELETIKNKMYE
jgi:hypothetical protein